MTFDERVAAVAKKGFTERQARFLTTVMLHTGVCVPRQYARFCGIVYGEKTRKFFAKLVRLRYALMYDCRHNRARIYHVNQRALYAAIGEADSRLRKPVTLNHAIQRLMVLDAIVEDPDLVWLGTADEKATHLLALIADRGSGPASRQRRRGRRAHRSVLPGPPADRHSSRRPRRGRLRRHRPWLDEFRVFLERHAALLRALPAWTLRIVVPPQFPDIGSARETGRLEPAVDAAQDRDARRVALVFRAGSRSHPAPSRSRRPRRAVLRGTRGVLSPSVQGAVPSVETGRRAAFSPAVPTRSAMPSTPARAASRPSNSVTATAISPPGCRRLTHGGDCPGARVEPAAESAVASAADSPYSDCGAGMTQKVEAIYTGGVLKPTRELSLRDKQRVRLTVETIDEPRGIARPPLRG